MRYPMVGFGISIPFALTALGFMFHAPTSGCYWGAAWFLAANLILFGISIILFCVSFEHRY